MKTLLLTNNQSHILYMYIVLFTALILLLTGCGAKSQDEYYAPITDEYIYEDNEISDICQYKNYTILAHENGYAYYDCVTGNLEEKTLPISNQLSLSIYQNLMYILDEEAKLIYEIDLHNFSELNTIHLGDQVGVVNYFAAGKDYLIFYGMVDDEFSFLIYHKESEHLEIVKTKLHVEHMAAMQDNKVLMYIYGRSTDECYYTVYDMETDTFQDELHINDFAGTDCTYREKSNTIEYYVNFDALYINSLSIEDGSIRTRRINERNENGNIKLGSYANLTVYLKNNHELLYMDDMQEQYDVTVATIGYMRPTLRTLIRDYSIQNDCLISAVTFETEEKYKLSLLAGDPIDCYLTPMEMNIADFVRNDAYVDLLQYEPFGKFVDENGYFLKTLAQTDTGELFGVPVEVLTRDSISSYAAVRLSRYLNDTVDLVNRTYSDETGNQLQELFNACDDYFNHGAEIPTDYPLFYEAQCCYLIMNPNSEHKEETAKFIAYAYQVQQQISEEDAWKLEVVKYPVFTEDQYYYGWWKFRNQDIYLTLLDVINQVTEENADIDTMAEKTALRIKQIVME